MTQKGESARYHLRLCQSPANIRKPARTPLSVNGDEAELLTAFRQFGSKATFHKSIFKAPYSRRVLLSGKSCYVLLFLTTFICITAFYLTFPKTICQDEKSSKHPQLAGNVIYDNDRNIHNNLGNHFFNNQNIHKQPHQKHIQNSGRRPCQKKASHFRQNRFTL